MCPADSRIPFPAALTALSIFAACTAFAAGPLGALSPLLDMLNHLAGWFFVGSGLLLAALIWQWRGRWVRGAASIVCAVFATLVFGSASVPEAFAAMWPAAPAERQAPRLRVISLNMWVSAPDHGAAISYLARAPADIVVLQEAAPLWSAAFAPLRAAYPYVIPSISAPYAYVAILSRHPPISVNALAGAHYDLAAAGGPARYMRWADAAFEINGVRAHVVAFHAHRGSPQETSSQLDALAAVLCDARDPAALIVVGDFNATPSTHALRRFGGRSGLSRATRAIATYPAPPAGWAVPFPIAAIDHVFTGPDWTRIEARRGPNVGSDHYPVEALLGFRP